MGHRVRAVDGTGVLLPRSQEILQAYPIRKNRFGKSHYPSLNLLSAVDIFTGQPSHIRTGNMHMSERDALMEIISEFKAGDITILDRGFSGKRVWKYFTEKNQYFIARLKLRDARGILKLNQTCKAEIIELSPGLKIRVLRGEKLKSGEHIYLITNLLDEKKYKKKAIFDLYSQRQSVEEMFLYLKQVLNVKNIRSKKVNGVLQEIYAALVMGAVVAGLKYKYKNQIKKRKSSFKAFAWGIEKLFTKIFCNGDVEFDFSKLNLFYHCIQPGRSYPRFSRQPENKWIREKRKKAYRKKNRMKNP